MENIAQVGFKAGLCALFILPIARALYLRISQSCSLPLPPGPPASPVGHHPAALVEQWIETYGPVISMHNADAVLVIVGRHEEALEIMEKNGACLADRPPSIAGGEILGRGMRFVQMRVGDRLRNFRKTAHAHLQLRSAQTYEPMQAFHARNAVLDILNEPSLHQRHIKRLPSVIFRVVYGKTTPTALDDPYLLQLQRMIPRIQSAMIPGAYLVDKYPLLRYVPGYGRDLKAWSEEEYSMLFGKLNWVRNEMAKNTAPHSITRDLLSRPEEHALSDGEMAYLSGSLIGAGSDTTAVAISTIIMAAAYFPHAQAKVQEELDTVIGRDSAPAFSDRHLLPQLQAFILEALRWRPVNPIGFPHRATKDIIWKGYRIPAGATVFGNHWAIGRDPAVYPDPETFNPQRWLDNDGRLKENMRLFTFGFGRRACPGTHVANRSMFIVTALILWSFKLSEDPSAPIDDMAFSKGVVSHQLPFAVCFDTRMEESKLRKILESYVEETEF
ncbi:cytochrome P450 [Hygrophoropsis aurantiaca]|uniref:Cytochrome P450 n=1 Tax=Hygrophoropsis aurantiaca TaxID=72124 RepID=A0ACB8A9I9_9AGAM|nr:cytochrome P450 [Hygrophoropsis aurantiaca]